MSIDESYKITPPRRGDHRTQFKKLMKKCKTIYSCVRGAILLKKEKFAQNHYVSPDDFPFRGEITVFGDKVILVSDVEKLIGIVVKDQSISDTVKRLFELALLGIEHLHQCKKSRH